MQCSSLSHLKDAIWEGKVAVGSTRASTKSTSSFQLAPVPSAWISWRNDLGTKVIVPQEAQKCTGAAA